MAKAHTKNTARIAIMMMPNRGPVSSEIAEGDEDCKNEEGDCVNAGSLGAICGVAGDENPCASDVPDVAEGSIPS